VQTFIVADQKTSSVILNKYRAMTITIKIALILTTYLQFTNLNP